MTNLIALPDGTELVGDYRISRVLGAGGFGITYLADELALSRSVSIKEYFPADFATRAATQEAAPRSQDCASDYRWGLDRFIDEAKTLAKFTHPNIVRVYRYFRANNTGYMVLHFEEGQSLRDWLKGLGRAPRQKELDAIVPPLLDALELIHDADFLHRDIAPDNIIIRKSGEPVLIDFGAARGEVRSHSKAVSALVKPGYSPYEQYAETSRQQGPWSDIYALAATLYHAVTGKRPPDAPSRVVRDELVPAREAARATYRPGFLAAIDRALTLPIEARPQSIAAWRGDLLAPGAARTGWLARTSEAGDGEMPPRKAQAAETVKLAQPTPAPAFLKKRTPAGKADGQPNERKPKNAKRARSERVRSPAPEPAAAAAVPASPKPIAAPPVRRSLWRQVRPLVVKLIVGAGIAGGAVALQDRLSEPAEPTPAAASTSTLVPAPLAQLEGHKGPVTAVAYGATGREIVTAGSDATLRIWSAAGHLERTIPLDEGPATSLTLSGTRMLTGHGNGQIVLWDLERGERLSSFKRSEASIWSVVFTEAAERFAASAHDRTISLWDVASAAAPLHVLDAQESAAQGLAYAAGGPLLAAGGADRAVKLWNLTTMDLERTYRGHRDFVAALGFRPDGRLLATAGLDGSVRLWSVALNRQLRTLEGHKGRVGSLAFSPSGELLATAGEDGTVRLWDVGRGRTLRTLLGHGGGANAVAFAPDGARIAVGGGDGLVRLWPVDVAARPSG